MAREKVELVWVPGRRRTENLITSQPVRSFNVKRCSICRAAIQNREEHYTYMRTTWRPKQRLHRKTRPGKWVYLAERALCGRIQCLVAFRSGKSSGALDKPQEK